MIAMLTFSAVAALLVFLAGRRDAARDPRLTLVALGLLAVFPLLWFFLPKVGVLPVNAHSAPAGEAAAFPWTSVIAAVWAVGFLYGAVRLLFAARGISAWGKRSVSVGFVDGVDIRMLPSLRGPVATGVFRRIVFVPAAWETWSDETRRIVMAHELAHHQRRDPLWRWIAEIACVVNGCNPLVTWMARRLAEQCEYACDVRVLSTSSVTARDYARLLCDFAESSAPHGPVLAMSSTGSALESRVRRLMKPAGNRGGAIVPVLLIVVTGVATGLAILGPEAKTKAEVFTPQEVELRWTADAFPGN
jgi:beta-lactamase regulating signal transducer with metallopeptidase domain